MEEIIVFGLIVILSLGFLVGNVPSFSTSLAPNLADKLYLPFVYLQYGPSPSSAVVMYFSSAEVVGFQGNKSLNIFNPNTVVANFSEAKGIRSGSNVQPAFDSFFIFNRLKDQLIPSTSNVSLQLYHIRNGLEVSSAPQAELDPPLTLISLDGRSFRIPDDLHGYYFAEIHVNFPAYKINATYSNSIYVETPGSNATNDDSMFTKNLSSSYNGT